MLVLANGITPRSDDLYDLYDLYDLFPFDLIDPSGQTNF